MTTSSLEDGVAIIINIDKSSSVFCVFHLETFWWMFFLLFPTLLDIKDSRGLKLVFEIDSCTDHGYRIDAVELVGPLL